MTVHPAPLAGEHLTVSDALSQMLDLVDALERSEAVDAADRRVVWRLTEAHTNSPPFTVVVEPYPRQTDMSVALEANRIATVFASDFRALLQGQPTDLMTIDAQEPIARVLDRNLNGIGRTDIQIDDDEPITVRPQSARTAQFALERAELDRQEARPDWQRTEHGAVEGEIIGLTRWNGKPALEITERLSEKRFTCVLTDKLSAELGPAHQWSEVWDGRRVLLTGALHYNPDGDLRRADVDQMEELQWADVPLSEIQSINVLNGRTLAEHLTSVRGAADG